MSMITFNTAGASYATPSVDHKYHCKHSLPFGSKERSLKDKNYMTLVCDRAKLAIDPRKYTSQRDWKRVSVERPNVPFNRQKKVTSTAELMDFKK